MKKIDTSAITSYPAQSVNSWMPVIGNWNGNNFVNGSPSGNLAGLDFLQQAYFECINALSQFIINDPTQPTIMYIAPAPPAAGFARAVNLVTQGYMYYEGEIYYFSFLGIPAIVNGGQQYQNASIVTDFSSADPITFSDGTKNNVHQVRQVQFNWSGTRNAGNIPDYDLWLNASNNSYGIVLAQSIWNTWIGGTYNPFVASYNTNLNPVMNMVNTSGPGTLFQSGWNNSIGIPEAVDSTPNPLSFYKVWNRVYITGSVANSAAGPKSTIFILPSGYLPLAYEEVFEIYNTGNQNADGGNNASPPYYLVITNDTACPGAVMLLSYTGSEDTTASRNISLSGISFVQGDYTSYYTEALSSEIAAIAEHTHEEYYEADPSYTPPLETE
jgi:hypothetical protein